jgi:hypothetical protein
MKQHEREFFISLIRSGKYFVNNLIIIPPTIDQYFQACQVYNQAFQQAYVDGMMSESEIDQWMREQDLWSVIDDEKLEGLNKDIERLKIEIYNARDNDLLRERIRLYIRAGEKQLVTHSNKKNQYYLNTCEGFASYEKLSWIIKNTTYQNNTLYDFGDISLQYIVDEYQSSAISESKIRELSRSEHWKSLWVIRENAQVKIFNNSPDQELTYNQKNLIIWSQTYDNIQESMDCPQKEVIEDDDLLDGWFILQGKKREKERNEKEFEDSVKNDKIKNSSEVFVMANNNKDLRKIDSLNNPHTAMIKKQREELLKNKGAVTQDQFADERLNLQMKATNQLRGRR